MHIIRFVDNSAPTTVTLKTEKVSLQPYKLRASINTPPRPLTRQNFFVFLAQFLCLCCHHRPPIGGASLRYRLELG